MHRRRLRYYYSFVFNNPPFSPCLRVTLLPTINTSGKTYHSKILKTQNYKVSVQTFNKGIKERAMIITTIALISNDCFR